METTPLKPSKDESGFLEKDEIPPDSDIKHQYREHLTEEVEKKDAINENEKENEDKIKDNEDNTKEVENKENEDDDINKENKDNKDNKNIEEKEDNEEEQKSNINEEKQINEEDIVNQVVVENEQKDNYILEQKIGEYNITPSGEVYEVIQSREGYQEYQLIHPAQPAQSYQIIQNGQEYEKSNQIQEYPITQPSQEYQRIQQSQEYELVRPENEYLQKSQENQQNDLYQVYESAQQNKINQAGEIYENKASQNQEYETILPSHNYQISDQGQIYEITQQSQAYPIVQYNQDYQYLNTNEHGFQYTQMGQPYEIVEQIQGNKNSKYIYQNQYYQAGKQNQIYQILGQPYEYKETQENYIPIILEGHKFKEITESHEPEIYQEVSEYNENILGSNEYQTAQFKNNVNKNQMAQLRKGFHQPNSTKKKEKQKIKRKNSQPKDSISKKYVKSKVLKNSSSTRKNKGSFYISKIPKLVSFHDMSTKKINIGSSVNLEKENFTEFIEVPREEYKIHANIETLFVNSGMDTGKYEFLGKEVLIKEKQTPSKVKISEEEVMNEIAKRTSNKKNHKLKYVVLDKYFTLFDFDKQAMKEEQFEKYKQEKERIYGLNEINNGQDGQGHFKSQSQSMIQANMKLKSKVGGGVSISSNASNTNNFNKESSSIKFDIGLSLVPMDNYSKYLLEQINKIRIDPQSFIGVIEDAKANIEKHRYGGYIYRCKIKIALCEGEPAFNEAIDYLQNTESMGKLEFCPQLTAQLPQNEIEIKDKDDLRIKVDKMIDNGINIKSFWRDLIKDPEISFLLMIVDDNGVRKGMRRRDLLNPHMKYIGISSVEINKKFVCYITLSSKLEK